MSSPIQQRRPRPGPPAARGGSGGGGGGQQLLNTLYQCIDNRNFSKVIKLTSLDNNNNNNNNNNDEKNWDIVRALRAHSLERLGRRREALLVLWDLLVASTATTAIADTGEGQQRWRELKAKIEYLSSPADVVISSVLSSSSSDNIASFKIFDPIVALDSKAHAPIPLPSLGATNATSSSTRTTTLSSSTSSKTATKITMLPPITDALVLKTISVALKNEGLYSTISTMYHTAIEYLMNSRRRETKEEEEEEEENYTSILQDGIHAHLSATCDCTTSISTTSTHNASSSSTTAAEVGVIAGKKNVIQLLQSTLHELNTSIQLTTYHERMQMTCLQLAKTTSQPLHYIWTSIVSLWYRQSLVVLVQVLNMCHVYLNYPTATATATTTTNDGMNVKTEDNHDKNINDNKEEVMINQLRNMCRDILLACHHSITINDNNDTNGNNGGMDIPSLIDKLRRKIDLLPRLAESLSSRVCVIVPTSTTNNNNDNTDGGGGGGVSENDWNVYLETLLVQDKQMEAIDILKSIYCGDGNSNQSSSSSSEEEAIQQLLPKIHDEQSVQERVGSMLPYTHRNRMEKLGQLYIELHMYTEAEKHYCDLLLLYPDQWTYWLALIKCATTATTTTTANTTASGVNDGWERCMSFAKDIIATRNNTTSGVGRGNHEVRGPYLVLIELIAQKLRQVDGSIPYYKDDSSNDNIIDTTNITNIFDCHDVDAVVLSLYDEICSYGTKFSPVASCCFADLRPYIHLLVQSRRTAEINIDDIPADVLKLLSWAKEILTANSQINTTATTTTTELSLQERRKQLRRYIFAVQVVFDTSNEMFEDKQSSIQHLRMYAPTMSDMVNEWRTSLTYLPIVCARDGGQKEVLPGDEIVLLASQYLLFEGDLMSSSSSSSSSFPFFLKAASLLEEAIGHSPYNPHLKIAAISAFARLGATERALCIYDDLEIKQIQLDSCSYIILPLLIKGGMYTSAIKLAALILRLHGTTSKDVKNYSSDALGNGLMFKTNEMVTFQREKMRPSLQLLQAKAFLLDTAPLMIPSELEKNGTTAGGGGLKHGSVGGPTKLPSFVGLASEKGFCGNDTDDLTRAEQLVIDAESHFNAPSIIHFAGQTSTIDDVVSSDNRDLTIYYYESLYRTSHSTERDMIINSLRSGHVQGLLVRAIMAVGCASAPKKGKVPKSTNERSYRCQSLRYAVSRATEFGREAFLNDDDVSQSLWDACCQLCNAIVVIINGDGRVVDTLAEREVVATSYIESTMQMITNGRTALSSCYSTVGIDKDERSLLMSARVCQLLPEYVVPLYVFIETTARLFALFGWGKRKRRTKSSSGALASAALSLQDLISDMLLVMNQHRSSFGAGGDDIAAYTVMMVGSGSELLRADAMHRVIKDIAFSREKTKDRVDSFLMQMKKCLDSFKDE